MDLGETSSSSSPFDRIYISPVKLNIVSIDTYFLSADDITLHISGRCHPDAAQFRGMETTLAREGSQVGLFESIHGGCFCQWNQAILTVVLSFLGHLVSLLHIYKPVYGTILLPADAA